MNIKRAVGYSILLWAIIFAVISILMFLPWLKDSRSGVQMAWWFLAIPITLFWAKFYFKADPPTAKKGFYLGLIGLIVSTILDAVITVPLFIKSYSLYFGDLMLYAGYVELLVLCVIAGGEFDATFTSMPKEEK